MMTYQSFFLTNRSTGGTGRDDLLINFPNGSLDNLDNLESPRIYIISNNSHHYVGDFYACLSKIQYSQVAHFFLYP